jgi:hypothetical protein
MKVYRNKTHDMQIMLSLTSGLSNFAPQLQTRSIGSKATTHVTSTVKAPKSRALTPKSFLVRMTTEASWTEKVGRAAASAYTPNARWTAPETLFLESSRLGR